MGEDKQLISSHTDNGKCLRVATDDRPKAVRLLCGCLSSATLDSTWVYSLLLDSYTQEKYCTVDYSLFSVISILSPFYVSRSEALNIQ